MFRCYRKEPQEAVTLDSGHEWERITLDNSNPKIHYNNKGVLEVQGANNSGRDGFFLIRDFEERTPYVKIKLNTTYVFNWKRGFYIKYLDKTNWIWVELGGRGYEVYISINGEIKTAIRMVSSTIYPEGISNTVKEIEVSIKSVHSNVSESEKVISVVFMGTELKMYAFTNEEWEVFNVPTKVGIGSRTQTEIYEFKAGVAE